jgi:hypothetical protein
MPTPDCMPRKRSLALLVVWAVILGGVAAMIGRLPARGLVPVPPPAASRCAPSSAVYVCTDVSPDQAFGTQYPGTGGDASGRVISVVTDPTNSQRLFAATDQAGVWISTDGAHTWQQASRGLRNGNSAGLNVGNYVGGGFDFGRVHPLSLDTANPQRLIYAARDTTQNPSFPFGGLYVTTDGAQNWHQASLPCAGPGIIGVTFSGGVAFVLTNCGVFSSTDLSQWTLTPAPFTSAQGGAISAAGHSGQDQTVYECGIRTVQRSTDSGRTWAAWDSATFSKPPANTAGDPVACLDLAVVPDDPANQVLVMDMVTDVWLVNFANASPTVAPVITLLGFKAPECCGTKSVVAALRGHPSSGTPSQPGVTYDILASDGYGFTEYQPGTTLTSGSFPTELPSGSPCGGQCVMHPDTWGMAVPSGYDPGGGNCGLIVANDGGLYANSHSQGGACTTSDGPWVHASSGLHVGRAIDMAGVSQTGCSNPRLPCPALYASHPDNETWGSLDGGATWADMCSSCLGDSSAVLMDPRLPTQMVSTRNGRINEWHSSTSSPPSPSDFQGGFDRPTMPEGNAPPQAGDLAQVISLPTDQVAPYGDYFAVNTTSTNDQIVRNEPANSLPSSSSWQVVSNFFPPSSIVQLQAVGGHTNTTLYALKSDGTLWTGQVDDNSGTIGSWTALPAGADLANFVADPYQRNVLYATDAASGRIITIYNNGNNQTPAFALNQIATNYGVVTGTCQGAWCPLMKMEFVPTQPEYRIASLYPGGVAFSRDAGGDWIPLGGVGQPPQYGTGTGSSPFEVPTATFYDSQVNPTTGTPSLYVAFDGHGNERVDAPFPTLEGIEVTLNGLTTGNSASLVDDTTGIATPLQYNPIAGSYQGTELIDSAKTTSFSYHYLIDGIASAEFTHSLTSGESANGVVYLAPSLNVTYTGNTSGDYHDQVLLAANVTLASTPFGNAPVTFQLGNQTCQATTGADGSASCPLTINQSHNSVDAVIAKFTNPATGATAASASSPFTINLEEDTVAYTGSTVILQGGSGVTLKGLLLEDGNTSAPIVGRALTLSLGAQSCTATTGSDGTGSCSLTFTGSLGPQALGAAFPGDAYYLPSSDTGKTAIVFSFPTRGAFTLGDMTASSATSSTTVTWWADTWSQLNSLSGGPAPKAFKGFAAMVSLPTSTPPSACAGNWTSTTGNSPPPTSGVPSYMGVLVTSGVRESGNTVSGNTVHIVVVKVNPGYAPNPMNHGTGTIVATYC